MLSLQVVVALLGAVVLVPTGVILLSLGLPRPGLTAMGKESATGGLVPHPVRRFISSDHRSTPAERRECRARLGPRYDAHLVVVADIMARRPAVLRDIMMETQELPIEDLVTLSAYLDGPPIGLDRTLRKGTAEVHRAVIACLTSGLRRFPAHRGACFGVAHAVGVPLDVYVPGRTIVEPAFLRTGTQPPPRFSAGAAASDTEIVFAFWSRTGRQVGSLGTDPNTVIFAAGTRFRVLSVKSPTTSDEPGIVFLSEGRGSGPLGLGKRRIVSQLQRQMTVDSARTAAAAQHPPPALGFTPGFDGTGRPYQEQP